MRITVICIVLSMLMTQHTTVAIVCSVHSFQNYAKLLIDCDAVTTIKFYLEKWDRIPQDFIDKTQTVRTIDVTGQNITHIENNGFCDWHGLSAIIANTNNITTLSPRMLINCRFLKLLSLVDSNITEIYEDAFHGLSALFELDLSNNQISSLSDNVFKPLKSLETLRLNDNKIVVINNDFFEFNQKLKTLEISRNSLNVIEKGAFWKLKQLVMLDVSNNPDLKDIDLSEMDRLKSAYINNASLTSLHIPANVVKVFAKFNRISSVTIEPNGILEELYLNHNLFWNFEGLSHADKLNLLDISDNNITTMNFTHLMGTEIHHLYINNNPINSFNVTHLLASLLELRDIEISFHTLDNQTLLNLDNQTRSKHIKLSDPGPDQSQEQTNSFTTPSVTPVAAKDLSTASMTFDSTTMSSTNVPITPKLTPNSASNDSKDAIITELLKRIRALESRQIDSSEVHNQMLANVSNLRAMIVCTIVAFSIFVSFQIAIFISTKYSGWRIPIPNVFANRVNGISNHRRQRNINSSMDPIMEEVL